VTDDAHTVIEIRTEATRTTMARIELDEDETEDLREWVADERWKYDLSAGAWEFSRFAAEALGAMPMEEDS
jgi:hypothetical protein